MGHRAAKSRPSSARAFTSASGSSQRGGWGPSRVLFGHMYEWSGWCNLPRFRAATVDSLPARCPRTSRWSSRDHILLTKGSWQINLRAHCKHLLAIGFLNKHDQTLVCVSSNTGGRCERNEIIVQEGPVSGCYVRGAARGTACKRTHVLPGEARLKHGFGFGV